MQGFLKKALRPAVVKRAAIMSIIVGVIIAIINYYDKMMVGSMTLGDLGKIVFTFLVPYTVSTVSSVMAIYDVEKLKN